jgi:hypothetical protein
MGCFPAAGQGAERHVNRAWGILTAAARTARRPDAGRTAWVPAWAPSAALTQSPARCPRWEPSAPVPRAASRPSLLGQSLPGQSLPELGLPELGRSGPCLLDQRRSGLDLRRPGLLGLGGRPQSGQRRRPPPGRSPAG